MVAGVSGSLHRSGGFAAVDQTWVLESDGTVLGPEGYTGTVSAADRARLEAAVDAAGFFDLDAEYLPVDTCCDRFVYELTLTRGATTHTVTTIDAADAPETLFDLIQTFLRGRTAGLTSATAPSPAGDWRHGDWRLGFPPSTLSPRRAPAERGAGALEGEEPG